MKKLLLAIALVGSCFWGYSQNNISQLEYFIDTDPGFGLGNQVTITPASILNENVNVNLTGLSGGIHSVYFRAKNDSGWSITYSTPFLVASNAPSSPAPNINKLEYYIDVDPGYGNGVDVPVTPGQIVAMPATIVLTGQAQGMHMVTVRARDVNNTWGHNYTTPFIVVSGTIGADIAALEYFIDADPGFGNGFQVPFTPGQIIDQPVSISLVGISSGLHMISLRAIDTNGDYSIVYSQPFIKSGTSVNTNIVELEYFVDTDPGFGAGTTVNLNNASVIDTSVTVNLAGVSPGLHILYIRAKDSNGLWSMAYIKPIIQNGTGIAPGIMALEYFFDVDPGFGAATSIALNGSIIDTAVVFNVTGLSDGMHILQMRAQDQNGNWGLTFNRPFIKTGVLALPDIVALEYHIDTFAGYGSGTNVPLTAASVVDTSLVLDMTGVPKGTHDLYVAALNQNGVWSLVYNRAFCIGAEALFSTDTVCFGTPTTFTDLSLDTLSITTYWWDYMSDGTMNDSTPGNQSFVYDSVGTYTAMLILDKDSLCPDTFITSVEVDSLGKIRGNVYNDAGPISNGYVKLFQYLTSGAMPLVDSVNIAANGDYIFDDLVFDSYIVRAHPDTFDYPTYVVTYFDSTFQWGNADVINADCDTVVNIGVLNINLVQGSGYVSGYVYSVDTVSMNKQALAGDPIPGIDISLEQIPGGIIGGQTQTDSVGFYEFDNLPIANFEIYVDIPGKGIDSTYLVVISSTDTLFENMNFLVDSDHIWVDETVGTIITRVTSPNYQLSLYPNPYNTYTNLDLYLNETADIRISVTDLVGRQIMSKTILNQPPGNYKETFSANQLGFGSGIYLMKVQVGGSVNVIRLIETR